ncbi:MAG: tetratricopeptide repeat protein [Candidatus Levyibacteriota bacterium]
MDSKKEVISYLDNASLFLLGITLLAFPLVIATITTDAITLPKQILLGVGILTTLTLFAIKSLSERKVILRRTPFDLPIVLFILAGLVSSILAVNRADSLTAFVPFFFSAFIYFVIVNTAKERSAITFLYSSLLTGAFILSILTILSFLKIYPLPFDFTHVQTFTTLGSNLDQVMFLGLSLALAGSLSWPLIKRLTSKRTSAFEKERIKIFDGGFFLATLTILGATLITAYVLVNPPAGGQNPIILPFETGFRTAFAEISQDSGRIAQGFLFGSGTGTYSTDFSRFKPAVFNNSALWNLTFTRSSSWVLETLATMGIAGTLAFLFLIFRMYKEKAYFLPVVISAVAVFILPFSFTLQTLFFVILGLYAASESLKERKQGKYFDVEPHFVTLRRGILELSSAGGSRKDEKLIPVVFFAIIAVLVGLIGFFAFRYISADITFQKSLVAASSNNGSLTYTLQSQAINTFPYRDAYYRIFSQTNLALANSLASQQPRESSPSAQTQQTILTLTQQSINAGRQATVISPQTAANWSNLASIYRSLIGFGENAEQFAIASAQQAVVLDPNNPNQYINLGGVYYQLGEWDSAQREFQIAVNLKPDLANAYYNLGHALEQKGDLKGALARYQTVRDLVQEDKENLETINKEIKALQARIDAGGAGEASPAITTPTLPPQDPQVEIPSPPATSSAR